MIHVIAIIITLLTIGLKAYFDNKAWGLIIPLKVRHGLGIAIVAMILIPLSFWVESFYPLFIFGAFWNLVINWVRGLPIFYIGKTAFTDKLLIKIFGNFAGEAFFIIMFLLLIQSLNARFI